MKTQYESLMENPEFAKLVSIETLLAHASDTIARLMTEQNVTRADLARRLNKSRAWVTQLLNGNSNLTIRTLAEVAYALGAELRFSAQPVTRGAEQRPATTSPAIVFTFENRILETPSADQVFTLQSLELKPVSGGSGSAPPDPSTSEYAA